MQENNAYLSSFRTALATSENIQSEDRNPASLARNYAHRFFKNSDRSTSNVRITWSRARGLGCGFGGLRKKHLNIVPHARGNNGLKHWGRGLIPWKKKSFDEGLESSIVDVEIWKMQRMDMADKKCAG